MRNLGSTPGGLDYLFGPRDNWGAPRFPARIAIVAAMRREVAPLIKAWKAPRWARGKGPKPASLYISPGGEAAVTWHGMGRWRAGFISQHVLLDTDAEILISAGFAGALIPDVKVGDVVVAAEIAETTSDTRFVTGVGSGTLVTGLGVVDREEKLKLAAQYGACAVDMEASSVARIARDCNARFLAIKAISDDVNFEMPPLGQFMDGAGRFETTKFLGHAASRPKVFRAMLALGKNSLRAAKALSAVLDSYIRTGGFADCDVRIFGMHPATEGRTA